jgi:hypothetical protein
VPVLGLVPGLAGMHDLDDYPQAQTVPGLYPTLPAAAEACREWPASMARSPPVKALRTAEPPGDPG